MPNQGRAAGEGFAISGAVDDAIRLEMLRDFFLALCERSLTISTKVNFLLVKLTSVLLELALQTNLMHHWNLTICMRSFHVFSI
jgi:hypothetical protein